jgi:tetratricopeptide (TPR) repeat protein
MIVRTLRSEFPHTGVIVLADGADTLLLASDQPLLPSPEALAQLQQIVDATPAIQADLIRWYGSTELRRLLLAHYLIGEEQLERLLAQDDSDTLNTDLHLLLEFDAPLHLFRKMPPEDAAAVGLLSAMDRKWLDRLAAQTGIEPDSAELELVRGDYYWNRISNPTIGASLEASGELEQAASHFERAAALQPRSADVFRSLARARAKQGRGPEAIAAWSEAVRLEPDDATSHASLAEALLKQKRVAEAVTHLREALRLQPELSRANRGTIWANNLAWILATHPDPELRNGAEAVQWATQVCEIDGSTDPATLDTLAAALAETGHFAEAHRIARRMLELAASQPEMAALARSRVEAFAASQPVRDE